MKMKHFIVTIGILLTLLASACSSSKGLTKEEKAEKEAVLRKAIENNAFSIDVDRVLPMSGRSRALTSSYSVEVDGDTIKSHLPYFGRAYSVPYGGGDGLNFTSGISEYTVSFNAKGKAVVELKTKTIEDQFVFRIEIYSNGSASIHVSMLNRQPITFQGTMVNKKTE